MADDPSKEPPGTSPPPAERSPTLGDLFWLGMGCAVSIVLAGGIGYALDCALGTLPWFTFAGLAFGVISAVLLAVSQVRKYL